MTLPIVIVGAGLAGVRTAQALRRAGYEDPITLIGDERHHPYERPALSKELINGKVELPPGLAEETWFASADVEIVFDERVSAISTGPLGVRLASGRHIDAEKVVLATGSRSRRLSIPGCDLDGVISLRSIDEGLRLKENMQPREHMVVVGAGLIGCEVASTARELGLEVTVVETAPAPLGRVLGPALGKLAGSWLTEMGVTLVCGVQVTGLTGQDKVTGVELADGRHVPASIVLVSIGAVPSTSLAESLDLDVSRGVTVDASGRTAVDGMFALGDAARWPLRGGGARSLETYLNTQEQAEAVAAAITGSERPSLQVPQFWTTIAGRRIQAIGDLDGPGDLIFRGAPDQGQFMMFRLGSDGSIAAAAAVDKPKDYGIARRLVDGCVVVDPVRLADASVPLRAHLENLQVS